MRVELATRIHKGEVPMHALTLLKTDHRKVETLFKSFEKTDGKQKKATLAKQIVTELSIHAAIEEQVFYPAVRKAMKKKDDEEMILEALEEHHIVKWVLSEIEKMDPEDERFDAKVKVLCENVDHHVKEEENELFKKVRKVMTVKQLNDLGVAMEAAKKVAPKRPHPRAPDHPPANLIAGIGAGMVDRARAAVRNLAKAGARRAAAGTRRRGATTTRRTKRSRASR
jgi:hemerythrin superfamily protein